LAEDIHVGAGAMSCGQWLANRDVMADEPFYKPGRKPDPPRRPL
jgi:hypothetical protein